MKSRLFGFFLRHLYPLKRDFDLLSDMLYWPLIDTFLWGITGQWLVGSTGEPRLVIAILIALVLWQVLWRSQSEISRNIMEEIWNSNLANLFSTPLSLREWIIGVLSLSIGKMLITISVLVVAIWGLYSVSIFAVGWWNIAFFVCTAMTGWWIGFISASIVIIHGQKMQTVVWTLPGIMLPLSAVYFPLDKLPAYIQPISRAIPTTYVFEAMRAVVLTGQVDWHLLAISFGLNLFYLALSIGLFVYAFERSRALGLGRFN
jgi:ABC-2 type transport system permease protein